MQLKIQRKATTTNSTLPVQSAAALPARLDQPSSSHSRKFTIARNQNTFAKRQREMEKKAKAEAKRIRRIKRKQGDGDDAGDPAETPLGEPETSDESD
ncbi:MAG: hypothetical protein IID45_12655 [Planctomycetes bacterium]|nr:hypothetical protein [Planctomycetota bacterium]